MKITSQIFSIPPYISTRWEYVVSLRREGNNLIVSLKDGTHCSIPNLPDDIVDNIFTCHAESSEKEELKKEEITHIVEGLETGFKDFVSMLSKIGPISISAMGKALEHDPNHANLPPLPPEIIKKIESLTHVLPKEEILAMPEAVTDCNCMYCQINRTLRNLILNEGSPESLEHEEPVNEEELAFAQWNIEPISDKLYRVTNKLDPKEEYRVFLGEPIGCTCGKDHCEHIVAVLRS